MKTVVLLYLSLARVAPINPNKHPTDVESLASEVLSTNKHRRSYAARELAYKAKRIVKRSQSSDEIESLEAKIELGLLNEKAVPACLLAIKKGFVIGPCSTLIQRLDRTDAIETLILAQKQTPHFWTRCQLKRTINHLEKRRHRMIDPYSKKLAIRELSGPSASGC